MENCIVKENNNDFLSQSYSQGIERITGTRDSTCNFQIPEQLLEAREKTWNNLFTRYSEEMSDDIEINVDTLEPEEEEEEEEEENAIREQDFSCGQRIPMRKPATLVQYWIDTGNPPYMAQLDENESSEAGSSLSEKESSLTSLVSGAVIMVDAERKHENDSSCSSVDTAVYILSNANVTKKADTVAITEGAKCLEIKAASSNDKRIVNDSNNGDVDIDVQNTHLSQVSTVEYTASETCDNVLVSANAAQSNIYSHGLSCEKTDKIDESSISKRNSDVPTIGDIELIFRQFDKTLKRLAGNDKNNDVSNQNKAVEMDTFHDSQISENVAREIVATDASLTAFHRKKLYTGRDSPVDLMLTESRATNRLSGARESLHPALDPLDSAIEGKTPLAHKGKNKQSLFVKRNLNFRTVKRKEKREPCTSASPSPSNKITITEINDDRTDRTDDKIQDSNIDGSFKSSSDLHDNSDKRRDNVLSRECDDGTNASAIQSERCKQNLKPIVLLERIEPPFQRHKIKSTSDSTQRHIEQEKRALNDGSYSSQIENLEVETRDSDDSTILIFKCNSANDSQHLSSLSNCSPDSRFNVEDDFSALQAERNGRKDDKLSGMSENKELRQGLKVVKRTRSLTKGYTDATVESRYWQNLTPTKSKTYSHLYNKKNKANDVKLRDIKVVLKRLPLSKNCTSTIMKMPALDQNDTISQKEMLNQSKAQFSNPYGANKQVDWKLGQVRIVLERLPANLYREKLSDVADTNTFPNDKISPCENASPQSNDRLKSYIRKVVGPIRNHYSLRVSTKSKEDDKVGDTSDIVAERPSQDSTFQQKTFRHKNRSKASQDKYSVLMFTSDEDDFVRSIQHPRKRSKVSKDGDILGVPRIVESNFCDRTKLVISDESKDRFGRDSNTIRLSEKIEQRDVESIKMEKSFNSTQCVPIDSFETRKNDSFVLVSNEDDNDSAADHSNKRRIKKGMSFLNSKKDKGYNSKERSNGAIEKNGIGREARSRASVTFFQTKTFDSSDSERSNSYTLSTRKASKSSSVRNRLRHRDRADSIANKYSKRHFSSLDSSREKHNRIHDGTIDKEADANRRIANQVSDGGIKSRISNTRKDASSSSSSPITGVRNICKAQHVQEKMFSNTFLGETSLTKKRNISDKSKNSLVLVQGKTYVTPTVRKMLTFQTKSYYDSSDSSETS